MPKRVALKQVNDHKATTDYIFFLVSFLAAMIFAIAPVILSLSELLNPGVQAPAVSFVTQLIWVARVLIPLIVVGTLLRFYKHINRNFECISNVLFIMALLVELYFVWVYIFL